MLIKLLLILIPFILFSAEVVWDSNAKESISHKTYNAVIKEYVEMKYPEEVKAWQVQKVREEANEKAREKAREKANKQAIKKEYRENIITLNDLMWQDTPEVKVARRDWREAKRHCESLTLAGFNDWRLPSKEELESIVDRSRKPAIKKEFRFISSDSWSSTTYAYNTAFAWNVISYNGYWKRNYNKKGSHFVRCVRGRQ